MVGGEPPGDRARDPCALRRETIGGEVGEDDARGERRRRTDDAHRMRAIRAHGRHRPAVDVVEVEPCEAVVADPRFAPLAVVAALGDHVRADRRTRPRHP